MATNPPYPTVHITPSAKPARGTRAVFTAYINKHPGLKGLSQQIYAAALNYGLDPVYFASLINFESGGKTNATSKANAFGPAQIHIPSWVGHPDPRNGRVITLADVQNPTWNLQFGAFLFSRAVNKYGSYAAAYAQGYNPGYKGPGPFKDVPKTYVSTVTNQSPTTAAERGAETKTASAALGRQTWAVMAGGKLKFVTTGAKADGSPNPPKGVLRIFDQPLTKTDFLQAYSGIQDDWLAYTGKRPSFAQAAQVITKGWSQYQLRQHLTDLPSFVGSPVWKQNAPGYQDVYHQIYGPDAKPDVQAVKYAIVNNLGGSGFADYLRQRPDYVKSVEYKQNFTGLQNVYRQIFGEPGPDGNNVVGQATLHGYTADTFAAYLRSQPAYKQSPEALTRAYSLLDALGMITGHQATLTAVPETPFKLQNPIPTDKRAPADTQLVGIGLAPGLSP